MDTGMVPFFAGIISSVMFVSSHVPMLVKAYKTKDLHSYSPLNMVMVNAGNLIYWLYVVQLPVGPIWLLHSFYTISSALMLILYMALNLNCYVKWSVGKFYLKKCLHT